MSENARSMLVHSSQVESTQKDLPRKIKSVPQLIVIQPKADHVLPQIFNMGRQCCKLPKIATGVLAKKDCK